MDLSDDKVGGSQIQSVQIPDSKSDSPQFAGNFARFGGGIECGFSALVQFSTSSFLYGEVYHFGKPKQISNHFSFGVVSQRGTKFDIFFFGIRA